MIVCDNQLSNADLYFLDDAAEMLIYSGNSKFLNL